MNFNNPKQKERPRPVSNGMKILITTGIYPPKFGGPAQYAKNLKDQFEKMRNVVVVKTFTVEDYLPTGLRHLYFFLKILPTVLASDIIIALDTFSVGLPSVAAATLFNKKIIIRTGGDFLWEQYVERTNKKVLFKDFYTKEKNHFSIKENIIYILTSWTLRRASFVVFSTEWQRDIFLSAYNLNGGKTGIIENYYGEKEGDVDSSEPDFVASTRDLVWKNLDILRRVFDTIQMKNPNVQLYTRNTNFLDFMNVIKNSYAVILVSLGDISPNLILDAIRYNRPFICTKEVGILNRIKDVGIFVDPLDEREIELAVLKLLDKDEYEKAREKVRQFSFVHTWQQVAQEFVVVYTSLK